MSLSLEDLKGEMRENYLRVEEVLSGMDNYITKLEKRVNEQHTRIATLEQQLEAIVTALSDDSDLENGEISRFIVET